MAVNKVVIALCALGLSQGLFFQNSIAGFDRFWVFNKTSDSQMNDNWSMLSEDEQRALIKRYETLKEPVKDQPVDLQQRMDWFTQLPEKEKQKMREAWQQMSTQERNDLRKRMEKASASERTEIRREYIQKYVGQE